MIYINKSHEPKEFNRWKKNPKNKGKGYKELSQDKDIKDILRCILLQDQGYVCCYCGEKIVNTNESTTIEHVLSKKQYPQKQLNFDNMLASCSSKEHCNNKKGDKSIEITPLKEDCLTFFRVDMYGKIYPNPLKSEKEQKDAQNTIDTLFLNENNLQGKRRKLIIEMIAEQTLGSQSNEDVMKNYERLDSEGHHNEFYFVPRLYFGKG